MAAASPPPPPPPTTTQSSSSVSPSPGVKPNFKTPEGRYKLSHEKTHFPGPHYGHSKSFTQVTMAHLKEKPILASSVNSSFGTSSSVKLVTQRFLLGSVSAPRSLGFGGGNGTNKFTGGAQKSSATPNIGIGATNGPSAPSYDGEGTYVIFNVGDSLCISDYNTHDKEPIKAILFSSGIPVCHAFDSEAKDGHDLLIGMSTGDVFSVSLRQQLQDPGKKPFGAMHFNKDGSINNSRCMAIAWVPQGDGLFVVAHADGNIYIYDKNKEGSIDSTFPPVKEVTQFLVVHARSSKSNPLARWHICQGSINGIAFSVNGVFLATVGRDGYLRIFDFKTEQLMSGGKSYFGALLCCAWSMDSKYVLTGGEDDLVQVWSMEDHAVVAWGEGHNSWVSGVAFDSFWTQPTSDGSADAVTYRFGSVGQDTQLLLWDLSMDEVVMPLRRLAPSGGSPTFSSGSGQASYWENPQHRFGVLQAPPVRREVPKLSPVVAHRVHVEPLSGILFTKDAILTVCHEGHVKVWTRPDSNSADTSSKDANSTMSNNSSMLRSGHSKH